MEYLVEGIVNKKLIPLCQRFINEHKDIIEDVMLMRKPRISPITKKDSDFFLNKIKNKDKAYDLLKWRFYCYMNPKVKLIVVDKLKKKDKKNCLFKFTKKISDHAIECINLQINFSRLEFSNFIKYLFDNSNNFKNVSLDPYKKRLLNKQITVCIMKNVEEDYNYIYQSTDFYELVEGSKIFLNWNNYDFYEEQLLFCYGNDLNKSIQTFFRLKFLKFFIYKKYNLISDEFLMLSGSFYLFSLGLRTSRDIDIDTIDYNNNKIINKDNLGCKYDIKKINESNSKTLNPNNYGIYYGFKGNLKDEEIKIRELRYDLLKSKKALGDLYILNYYFKNKIILKSNDLIQKILFFRYKNFTKKILDIL